MLGAEVNSSDSQALSKNLAAAWTIYNATQHQSMASVPSKDPLTKGVATQQILTCPAPAFQAMPPPAPCVPSINTMAWSGRRPSSKQAKDCWRTWTTCTLRHAPSLLHVVNICHQGLGALWHRVRCRQDAGLQHQRWPSRRLHDRPCTRTGLLAKRAWLVEQAWHLP